MRAIAGKGLVLSGHGTKVVALAQSPEGDRLASAGASGPVRLWALDGGAEIGRMEVSISRAMPVVPGEGIVRMDVSAEGSLLAVGTGHAGCYDQNAREKRAKAWIVPVVLERGGRWSSTWLRTCPKRVGSLRFVMNQAG